MATAAFPVDEKHVDEDFDSNHTNQYSYSDESKKDLKLLKQAYEERDFKAADKIIKEMVIKAQISDLNKIHTACGYGFAELVEKYITEDKIDPNLECSFNDLNSIVPLHFCSGIGPDSITPDRVKCIDILIKNGAKVNYLTSRNDSPLHWATKLADFKVCEKLIKSGADVNILNTDNCSCGHGAAFYKNIQVLQLLLDSNLNPAIQDISGKNILHLLCKDQFEPTKDNTETKFIEMIENLVTKFKIDVNMRDSTDFTCLMFACEHGNLNLISKLIELGADVNYTNSEGLNAMLLAIVNSEPEVVKLLLKKGFNVKSSPKNISYITDSAYLNEIDILTSLIQAGCDVNETKQDEHGVILNPLWASCERSNFKSVEILLKNGADPIIRPDLQMTALHCTCMAQYENLPIAKLLVEYKCPINVPSTQAGETPIFLACNSGYSSIVDYLLACGVDPNSSSPMSRSCFQQAVFRSHKDIVVLLIEKGYKITEDDRQELNLFIMDLYQDGDIDLLNFLLKKKIVDKNQILENIKKVNSWHENVSRMNENSQPSDTTTSIESNEKSKTLIAEDLKLNLTDSFPSSIEELETYLATKCNLKSSDSKLSSKEMKI